MIDFSAPRVLPALGWDPTPGDPAGTRAAARLLDDLADDVGQAAALLRHSDAERWHGRAAEAFRGQLGQLRPELAKLSSSFATAAGALRRWSEQLAELQQRATRLDHELASAQAQVRASVLPASATAFLDSTGPEARVQRLTRQATDLHQEYQRAATVVAEMLAQARALAPRGPSLFDRITSTFVLDTIGQATAILGFVPQLRALFIAVSVLIVTIQVGQAATGEGSWTAVAESAAGLALSGLGLGAARGAAKARGLAHSDDLPHLMTVREIPTQQEADWRALKLGADLLDGTYTAVGAVQYARTFAAGRAASSDRRRCHGSVTEATGSP